MLVFAGMAPAALAADTADVTLSDISYENHSVFDFVPANTSYTVEQPYRFSKSGDNFPEPVVNATPNDPNADVSINSEKNEKGLWVTTIIVTNGSASKTYTLTSRPVGKNQYANGSFEEDSLTSWSMSAASTDKMSIDSEYAFAGSNSLKYIGKASTSYPWQNIALTSDPNVTFFSHFAVKSTLTMRAANRYTSYLSGGSHYYVDNDGEVITDDSGNALTFVANDYSTWPKLLTSANDEGWQRSMRISKGMSALQESAGSSSATGSVPAYFDEFYVGPLVISKINVTSDGESYIKCGEAETINFNAELLNQYGNKGGLTKETVTWCLVGAPDGVTINESTGELAVADNLSETGEFYVEAQVVPSFNKESEIIDAWKVHSQTKMGGRKKITVLPADAVAQLSDIEVNGGGIDGFTPATTAYDIYVPYVYEENNFNNYAMPVVTATPVDTDGNVEITYPKTVADGEKIYIDVTDASGILSTRYTLTIKTVGGNLLPDGGFETESESKYKNDDYGVLSLSVTADESAAGNNLMKIESSMSSSGNGSMMAYAANVKLPKNKTYVNGLWAKTDPNKPEGNTNVNFAPDIKAGRLSNTTNWRKEYTTDVYYSYAGAAAGNTLTLTNNWQKVMTAFASDEELDVNVALALPSLKTTTYLLLDELYIGELVVANMAVTDEDGKTSGTVAAGETITLTEKHTNQYGNSVGLTGTTTWEVLNNTDVTVDSNGNVTVKDDAAAGTAIIEATFDTDYTGAAQDVVKKRYALTVIPQDGIVDNENGTYTANYTNNTDKDMTLRFISALYEGEVLQTVVITDNITVKVGETYSGSNTLTAGSGQSVRNFLWDKTTLVPVITE